MDISVKLGGGHAVNVNSRFLLSFPNTDYNYCEDKRGTPGIVEIIHDSPFEALTDSVSELVLKEDAQGTADMPFGEALEASLIANRFHHFKILN